MCGRMVRHSRLSDLRTFAGIPTEMGGDVLPHYNLCPSQAVAAVHHRLGPRALELLHWGLIPFFAKPGARGFHNATAERVASAPSFRRAFAKQRCLILADGFYEWDQQKNPYYFSRKDGAPIAFAGIYDTGCERVSCALITTAAGGVVSKVHHREPVILEPSAWDEWLDEGRGPTLVASMLRPVDDAVLQFHLVSRRVNSPRENTAELVNRVGSS